VVPHLPPCRAFRIADPPSNTAPAPKAGGTPVSAPHALLSTILRSRREEKKTAQKQITDKLSIYIPQSKIGLRPVERPIGLSSTIAPSMRSSTPFGGRTRVARGSLLAGIMTDAKVELALPAPHPRRRW